MKSRRKVYVSVFLASGFFVYICAVVLNFQYICTYQENTAKDAFIETKLSRKSTKTSAETEFCLQLFATLFGFCDEEESLSSYLIPNLSLTFAVSKNWFYKDTELSVTGLPLFYCNFLNEKKCSDTNDSTTVKNGYPVIFKSLPKSLSVLASFTNYSSLDSGFSVSSNQSLGFAITWPLWKLKQCQNLRHDDILHLIYSYHQRFSNTNLNFRSLCLSLHIISISPKPDLLAFLKNKIPHSFQPQTHLYQHKLSHTRRKRSISRPSPGILYPTEIATPFIPTRVTLFPSHVESTPVFASISPINIVASHSKTTMKPTTVVNKVTTSTETPISRGDIKTTEKQVTSNSQVFAATEKSREIEQSGSYFGSGKDESGSGLLSVESRTNRIHRNFSISSTLQSYIFETHLKNISKPISIILADSKSFTTLNSTVIASNSSHKIPLSPFSNLSFVSFFETKNTPKNLIIPTHFPKTTQFVPLTTFSTNLSTLVITYTNSNIDHLATSVVSHGLEMKKSVSLADVVSFPRDADDTSTTESATFTTKLSDPIIYTLTATIGKIFQLNVPKSWKAYLKDPDVKINFSEIINWLSYDHQLMKIIGVPLTKTKKTFALLITVYAPFTSTTLSSLSLKIEVHSKSILANPSYVVETNFTASAQQFSFDNKNEVQNSRLSYNSALFIIKLSKFLTHVDPDDISIISAVESAVVSNDNAIHSTTISIRWFVEKFTPTTFSKHYTPSILNANTGEATRDFFFALLPEFIFESVRIISPATKADGSILATIPDLSPNQHIHLSVALPIIVVLVFILLATLILILRYRRKKERFGKNILIDRTYAKRRKPVCFRSEMEMYDFHPSKPKIFAKDFEIENEPKNWNETIFSLTSDAAKPGSSSDTTDSELVETQWNQFGHRSSGSYSFVNACFIPNDDCSSMNSATYDEKMAAKKGD